MREGWAAGAAGQGFTDPIGYASTWVLLAALALLAVLGYYAAVTRLTRPRPLPATSERELEIARRDCMARLDAIERDVLAARVGHRRGHQELSAAVRGFVDRVGPVPATTLTLAELGDHDPPELAAAVGLMYPSEFAPDDDGRAEERFAEALGRARELVVSWTT